jgi:hypothetical protein
MSIQDFSPYGIAFRIGVLSGAADLISTFRDEPMWVLLYDWSGRFYLWKRC